MPWILLSLAIILEVVATMSLRASEWLKRRIWILPIVAGYTSAFVFLGLALRVSCGVVLTAVAARVLFSEPLTTTMLVGIIFIAAGVLIVEIGASHG